MQGCARTDAALSGRSSAREAGQNRPLQLAANLRSLIAAKSLTSPPTRLVA